MSQLHGGQELRPVYDRAVQHGLTAGGQRLAVLGGVAALAAASLGMPDPPPIDANAKAHFRYLGSLDSAADVYTRLPELVSAGAQSRSKGASSQDAARPEHTGRPKLTGQVAKHGSKVVLELLPVFAEDSTFWAGVVLVDAGSWDRALSLDDRPRLQLLVRTILFRALRKTPYRPDLARVITETPRLRHWKPVLEMCLELAERGDHADLARLGA